jgi:hypothetical protein
MPMIDRETLQSGFIFLPALKPSRAVVRSDGRTFRLEAADRLVIFRDPQGSRSDEMSSIGFWYTHIRNGPSTECVVVMIPQPLRRPIDVLQQVEIIADKLAERLAKDCCLSTVYQFNGFEMALKAC